MPGEEQFTGRGVSRCASCDGGFYRAMDVAVIGGGDAAVHEALVLARTSARVHVICRSPLKAKREYIDRLDSRDNVVFHWDSEVTAIEGEMKVAGLALRNVRSGAETRLECAGVFPFIGVEPNTGFLPAAMRDGAGYAALCRSADHRRRRGAGGLWWPGRAGDGRRYRRGGSRPCMARQWSAKWQVNPANMRSSGPAGSGGSRSARWPAGSIR